MPLATQLDRKLRAAEESSDDEEYYEVTDRSSSESVLETGAGGDVVESDSEDEPDLEEAGMSDASQDDRVQTQTSQISFGALAKAQEALSKDPSANRKRKRGDESSQSQEDKLEALRERLRQIKAARLASGTKASKKADSTKKHKVIQDDESADDAQEDNDSNDSDADGAPKPRSSKHAPAIQSSKRMVSRKRKVLDVKKPVFRDPRFDNMGGAAPDDHVLSKRYSFLNDYRVSEIAELRSTIKKSKNEGEKEKLKKKLMSMESQQKAREAKEKRLAVMSEHKKKEKELVKQGKQPFFLKKSEQKKMVLVDRFQNMKSKQREHVIERRRKKVTSKERRNMPAERRAV